MASIWNSAETQTGASPFQTSGTAPTPGGGTAMRFQSTAQPASPRNRTSDSTGTQQPSGQLGLSPLPKTGSQGTGKVASSSVANDDSTGTTSSGTDTTISANDFLTLLVTEMQNQDPTAQTDPNEYINQLVQINSLEQLIAMNQNLALVLGTATSQTAQATGLVQPVTSNSSTSGTDGSISSKTSLAGPRSTSAESAVRAAGNKMGASYATINGNVSLPGGAPASQAVAASLNGRVRGAGHGHWIRDIPVH
jgi:flagellar basal-body rod modification protein FlgD